MSDDNEIMSLMINYLYLLNFNHFLLRFFIHHYYHNFDFIYGARWAEAKLKEKNT
jgi:hypothetical protein